MSIYTSSGNLSLTKNPITTFGFGKEPKGISSKIQTILLSENSKNLDNSLENIAQNGVEKFNGVIDTLRPMLDSASQDPNYIRDSLSVVLTGDLLFAYAYKKEALQKILDNLIQSYPALNITYKTGVQEGKLGQKYLVNLRIIISWGNGPLTQKPTIVAPRRTD